MKCVGLPTESHDFNNSNAKAYIFHQKSHPMPHPCGRHVHVRPRDAVHVRERLGEGKSSAKARETTIYCGKLQSTVWGFPARLPAPAVSVTRCAGPCRCAAVSTPSYRYVCVGCNATGAREHIHIALGFCSAGMCCGSREVGAPLGELPTRTPTHASAQLQLPAHPRGTAPGTQRDGLLCPPPIRVGVDGWEGRTQPPPPAHPPLRKCRICDVRRRAWFTASRMRGWGTPA